MFTVQGNAEKKAASAEEQAKRTAVIGWVRQQLQLTFNEQLLNASYIDAMEVICNEPDCAPIEVLIILGFPEFSVDGYRAQPNKWAGKILKPLVDVTQDDVMTLEIPVRCLNAALSNVDKALAETLRLLDGPESLRLASDLKALLLDAVAAIDRMAPQPPSQAMIIDDDVTPVRMSSTVNPASISVPASVSSKATPTAPQTSSVPTVPPMASSVKKAGDFIVVKDGQERKSAAPRHEKGTRPRGCPCCDPDNLDNLIDKMLFMDMPPL